MLEGVSSSDFQFVTNLSQINKFVSSLSVPDRSYLQKFASLQDMSEVWI